MIPIFSRSRRGVSNILFDLFRIQVVEIKGVRVMVCNANFNNFQLYHGGRFYWWSKPVKNPNLQQVTDKLYHIIVHRVHLKLTALVVIGSCKSNYHAATMAPLLMVFWGIDGVVDHHCFMLVLIFILLRVRSLCSRSRRRGTVNPVYKGHSREPANVAFMSSCPLNTV